MTYIYIYSVFIRKLSSPDINLITYFASPGLGLWDLSCTEGMLVDMGNQGGGNSLFPRSIPHVYTFDIGPYASVRPDMKTML
jgi:hypothetical protein